MTTNRKPKTLRDLYAEEERRAMAGVTRSAAALNADFLRITRVEERVREHPWLAVGAAAAFGFAVAPLASGLAGTLLPLAKNALQSPPWVRSLVVGFLGHAHGGDSSEKSPT